MALTMKIMHVDQLANGVLRFRRRFPKDVAKALGEQTLQVHIRNRQGLAFQREYAAIMQEFDRIVAETRDKLSGVDLRSPVTRWHDALLKAEGMISSVQGLEDDEGHARHLLAKGLTQYGEDPLVIKALRNPAAVPPKATLQDAVNIYDKERIKGDRDKRVRLDRVLNRIAAVLGPLDELPMVDLRREHGRKFRDLLLSHRKSDGEPLSIDAVKKDITIATAVVNLGITELDLEGRAANPFKSLELPKTQHKRKNEAKPPLPDELVDKLTAKLETQGSRWLNQLWRIMAGTRAHAKEVTHLELQDFDFVTEVLQIRNNALRGHLKTESRDRAIPLVGDALEAAKELVADMEGQGKNDPVFPAYAGKPRGSDSLTANLNKHLKSLGAEPKERTYGLRHRVAAKLRLAGAHRSQSTAFWGTILML